MNTYPVEFYDPLAIALNGHSLQEFVDAILNKYNRLDVAGFAFNEDLLPDFTYSQIQRELNIDVMASYVDLDSPAIPNAVEPDVLATGKIPRMKSVEYYNEDKLRKLKIKENRRDINRAEIINAAGVGVAEIIMRLVSRHTNSLSYQRDQVVSCGKFEITNTNNPNGIQNVTFANHVPAANKTTLTSTAKWWTSTAHSAEGGDANPIADLRSMVKTAKNKGVSRGHFEMNESFLELVLDHSKVKTAIAASLYPIADSTVGSAAVNNLSYDARREALGRIIGAPIVARDGKARVEKWNTSTNKLDYSSFDTFASNVVVFVPDGNIGEILTVEPILLEGGDYAFGYGRKLAITVGKDYVKKCLSYNSEMTSLVVPNMPKLMWYLYPCND